MIYTVITEREIAALTETVIILMGLKGGKNHDKVFPEA